MYKLIRFYNQNRKQIIKISIIIVFIICMIQILNYLSKNETNNNSLNNQITNSIVDNKKELISDKSAISGKIISESKLQKDTEIIDKFITYCNQKDITNAYNLLTDECKEVMFPTIQDFYNIYYSKIFEEGNKTYTLENWNENTYTVRITGDILSTGGLDINNTKHDYMTIVKQDGKKKLNVNNYIGRSNSNKENTYKNIKVTVNTIDTYFDYEIYDLTIENNSNNTILLDTSDDTKSVYLLDNKDMKYYFYNNEIIDNRLKVKSQFKTNLKIKFMNKYSSTRTIESLVFSKVVLDYNEYKNNENFDKFDTLTVNL